MTLSADQPVGPREGDHEMHGTLLSTMLLCNIGHAATTREAAGGFPPRFSGSARMPMLLPGRRSAERNREEADARQSADWNLAACQLDETCMSINRSSVVARFRRL